MRRWPSRVVVPLCVSLCTLTAAHAQFIGPVTDFEDNAWTPFVTVVMFNDPSFSGSTRGLDPADGELTYLTQVPDDPFSVVHSGSRAGTAFWGWLNPDDHTSWVRLTTLNADTLPNPALHLAGKVRFWAAATAFTDNTFGTSVSTGNLLMGIGVRETGQGAPQGSNGGEVGDIEWVGLDARLLEILGGTNGTCDTTADPNSDDVQLIAPGAAAGPDDACVDSGPDGVLQTVRGGDDTVSTTPRGGASLPSDGVMRLYEYDLSTGIVSVNGTPQGGIIAGFSGDGILSAMPNNRGTLDHLVLTNDPANAAVGAKVFLINVDDVEFESPVLDPPTIVNLPPPRPLDESVDVVAINPAATSLDLFLIGNSGLETPVASVEPGGAITMSVPTTPLPANVKLIARQSIGADQSDNSTPVIVTSPGNGPLRIAMAVRETDAIDHGLNCGDDGTGFDPDAPATLEFIGAAGQDGFGVPIAPRFAPQRDWFEIVFNPCDTSFGVGPFSGNGMLDINPPPDFTQAVWEGLYFRIDELSPTTGPFTVFIDDVVVRNGSGPGVDCVVDDFESYTPGEFIIGDFGGNGIADTLADGGSDDVQVVGVGGGVFPGQIIVAPGPDGILQTPPAGDDGMQPLHARFNFPGVAGTSIGLGTSPDRSAVTDEDAFSGTKSLKVEWSFTDASNLSSVLRLTTNGSLATDPPETFLNPDPVVSLSTDGTLCDGTDDITYSVMVKLAPPAIPADCDGDGDVDLLDVACMQLCFGEGPVSPACTTLDIAPNGAPDDAITFADFELFSFIYAGPQP